MSKIVFIDDFPDGFGGSEFVNNTFCKMFNISKIVAANSIFEFNPETLYAVGNISTMTKSQIDNLSKHPNYVILEHDYKFINTRHPWRYEDSVVPSNLVINTSLYANAKAIFTQTDDHTEVFRKNQIEGNFISLKSSLWSEDELSELTTFYKKYPKKISEFCVLKSNNWIKNTKGALEFCRQSKLNYNLISSTSNRKEFLNTLSQYCCLVFFPIARESFCRLIIEAKCMGLNVITSPNSGAWQSEWYGSKSGLELISFLKSQTEANIKIISEYL